MFAVILLGGLVVLAALAGGRSSRRAASSTNAAVPAPPPSPGGAVVEPAQPSYGQNDAFAAARAELNRILSLSELQNHSNAFLQQYIESIERFGNNVRNGAWADALAVARTELNRRIGRAASSTNAAVPAPPPSPGGAVVVPAQPSYGQYDTILSLSELQNHTNAFLQRYIESIERSGNNVRSGAWADALAAARTELNRRITGS